MEKGKLHFALIGCGKIARRHAEILSRMEEVQLLAVCDVIEERAHTFGERYGARWYINYDEMLEKEKTIQVVNVLTPSGLHARNVLDIVEYKKHIVVEKPMALTLDDADEMIDKCSKYGVKLFVVKQNRYNLPVKKLREAIEEDRFGRLVLGSVRVRWCRRQDYYDSESWRGTWAKDGGVITNQASHHIDLLTWMMGDVESVMAKTATRLVNIETEDTGVVILKFRNGSLGVIEATTAARPTDLEGSISILGERGVIEIGGFAANEMKIWNFEDKRPGDEEVLKKYIQDPHDLYGFGHREYLKEVIDSIINEKEAFVDGVEGRKSLELVNAVYESVETGKEVFLRFKPRKCRLGL
jgi:predicted dehydrogenase